LEKLRTLCGVFRDALARAIELGWLWRQVHALKGIRGRAKRSSGSAM